MRFGLEERIIEKIVSAIDKHKAVKRAVIFGSRARGDYRYNSDIDIAIYTDGQACSGLIDDIDHAAGIYKVDVVDVNSLENDDFKKSIERDGIEIYRRSINTMEKG